MITTNCEDEQQSALARAIAYLGAVEVAPERYAYRDDATQRYYTVGENDLRLLGEHYWLSIERESYDYSLWCADTHAVEMPADWVPGDPLPQTAEEVTV